MHRNEKGAALLCHHRSRLVESICIHLCNELTQPCTEIRGDGSKLYESRWKRILFKYNNIRARLFNSHTLSERTNISIFYVNETSIRLWYKHKTGREEIKQVMIMKMKILILILRDIQ